MYFNIFIPSKFNEISYFNKSNYYVTTNRLKNSKIKCSKTSQLLKKEEKISDESIKSTWNSLNKYLANNNENQAIKLINKLKEHKIAKSFNAAQCIPHRDYTITDLKLHKINTSKIINPIDKTLSNIRRISQVLYVISMTTGINMGFLNIDSVMLITITLLLLMTADNLTNHGNFELIFIETLTRIISKQYRERVSRHEAGHFLIAYLMGILPKAYTLSSLDAYKKEYNIQAGTLFCFSELDTEIKTGKIKSSTLDKFTCIAVAGVISEYMEYGQANGGNNDIAQLDSLMKSLKFTQKKIDSQVRWSVLNTTLLLRRYSDIHESLIFYMDQNKSISECLKLIESEISTKLD